MIWRLFYYFSKKHRKGRNMFIKISFLIPSVRITLVKGSWYFNKGHTKSGVTTLYGKEKINSRVDCEFGMR